MRVGIIGGGSIGLLFAYYLNQVFSVTIYTRTIEQADKINQDGIWLKDKEQLRHTFPCAAPIDCWQGMDEITLVTVKQYQLQPVLEKIAMHAETGGRLLFLQNGMGHIKQLKNLPNKEIYVGSVEHGAVRDGANFVYHNGVGVTRLACFRGDREFVKNFAADSESPFPFIFESFYDEMLVSKLIVNAVINPLTAVLQVQNGELINNSHYYKIFQMTFEEVSTILKLEKKEESFTHLVKVCKNTAHNRSSMLKDLDNNQPTEIEAILGYLLEEAEDSGVASPLVNTFYHLVKGKEDSRRGDIDG